MNPTPAKGRREQNKEQKLQRILAAATELFAAHGIEEVTTQQIAARAEIGTGTLFLYARNKGELLLLVQNARYQEAIDEGEAAAARADSASGAILAIARPIIACNRVHVGNGRMYLREMIFGDSTEPHHATALRFSEQTVTVFATTLQQWADMQSDKTFALARAISAVMFVTLSIDTNAAASVDDLVAQLAQQIEVFLPPGTVA